MPKMDCFIRAAIMYFTIIIIIVSCQETDLELETPPLETPSGGISNERSKKTKRDERSEPEVSNGEAVSALNLLASYIKHVIYSPFSGKVLEPVGPKSPPPQPVRHSHDPVLPETKDTDAVNWEEEEDGNFEEIAIPTKMTDTVKLKLKKFFSHSKNKRKREEPAFYLQDEIEYIDATDDVQHNINTRNAAEKEEKEQKFEDLLQKILYVYKCTRKIKEFFSKPEGAELRLQLGVDMARVDEQIKQFVEERYNYMKDNWQTVPIDEINQTTRIVNNIIEDIQETCTILPMFRNTRYDRYRKSSRDSDFDYYDAEELEDDMDFVNLE